MTSEYICNNNERRRESGNILFIILLAVALIGLLSAAIISSSNTENTNIDDEKMTIIVAQVQRAAAEFERGVNFILQNGYSESQIRFSHPKNHADYGDLSTDPDPGDQVFSPQGGGATFKNPPSLVNNGDGWEFYGNSVIPSVGSSLPDLIAVLPNVTKQFCQIVNEINGQNSPADTGTCIHTGSSARFNDSVQFGGATNAVPTASFAQDTTTSQPKPALQACVSCGTNLHFYHVLLSR